MAQQLGAMGRTNAPPHGVPPQSKSEEIGRGEEANTLEAKLGAQRPPPSGPLRAQPQQQQQAGGGASGQKRHFVDISNEQGCLVPGNVLDNDSGKIDIKEDGFFAGPYKQERMLTFEVEKQIEEAEMKEELTVGDRTSNTGMCLW